MTEAPVLPKLRLESLGKAEDEGIVTTLPLPVKVTDAERTAASERLRAAGFFDLEAGSTFQRQQEDKKAEKELSEKNRTQLHKLVMMD